LHLGVGQLIDQEKVHNQCLSKDPEERIKRLAQFRRNFSLMANKEHAWNDLHRLTNDKNSYIRHLATFALGSVFSYVPDKQQAWNELHRLTSDQSSHVRKSAGSALGSVFSYVPDKQLAWNDLVRLISDEDSGVRSEAAYALDSAFTNVSDKQLAWNDLVRLASNEGSDVRSVVAYGLGSAFSHVPDKQQAWNDLFRFTSDEDSSVRYWAGSALSSAFTNVSDKQLAWNDLHRLTSDEGSDMKYWAGFALGSVFSCVPDKQQAWNDLHRLTSDQSSYVRKSAAFTLGLVFSYVSDKQQAWNDLIRLASDQNITVGTLAGSALGSVFSYVPDKQQAWNDLIKMTSDEDRDLRANANHSLGKASIFLASQAEKEEDYKIELENAITFFEKASQESSYLSNPSGFCLPFYRSFHTIVFKRQEAKKEIDRYLAEAKRASQGSKNKQMLFEAVENLANALKEVQNLGNMGFEAKKGELNFYRTYCDRAAERMRDTEETAPFAIMAIRKGLPILDRNLKELIKEIQKKTEVISDKTKGTQFEELGNELNQSSQFLSQIRDPIGFKTQVNVMQNILKAICSKFPEDQKGEACELLKMMYAESSIEDKIPLMNNILSKFSYQLDMTTYLKDMKADLSIIKESLNSFKLDIFKIKLNNSNVISNLYAMKKELEKLNKIESLNTLSIEKLDCTLTEKLYDLNKTIPERLDEMKLLVRELSENNDKPEFYMEFSKRLNELEQPKLDRILQRSSALISLIGFVVSMLITIAC